MKETKVSNGKVEIKEPTKIQIGVEKAIDLLSEVGDKKTVENREYIEPEFHESQSISDKERQEEERSERMRQATLRQDAKGRIHRSSEPIEIPLKDDKYIFEKELFYQGICASYGAIEIQFTPTGIGGIKPATDMLFEEKLPDICKNVLILSAFAKFGPVILEVGNFYLNEWLDKLMGNEESSIQKAIEILQNIQQKQIGKPDLDK